MYNQSRQAALDFCSASYYLCLTLPLLHEVFSPCLLAITRLWPLCTFYAASVLPILLEWVAEVDIKRLSLVWLGIALPTTIIITSFQALLGIGLSSFH
jgi:hypothetical protein